MGNLHEGHLALVQRACVLGDVTVASLFVNRLQFLPHEDFDTYPRTPQEDYEALEREGCDVVFAPAEAELYPVPQTYKVHPPAALADILEGHFRPGFFVGVSTVLLKLFGIVRPAVAVFGDKDYQQLLVVRQLVAQFALPIDVVGHPTVRSKDGLALSSRNRYLDAAERVEAVQLSQTLRTMAQALRDGAQDVPSLETQATQAMQARGWSVDYLCIRRSADLQEPTPQDLATPIAADRLIVLGAARLGRTRLIDNLLVGELGGCAEAP